MIPVGIFNGYYPYTLDEVTKKIKSQGFSTVQLDLAFKDMELGPNQLTKVKCKKIRDAFRNANLPICAVSGYTNIVHPDLDERKRRVEYRRRSFIMPENSGLGMSFLKRELSIPKVTGSTIRRTRPRKGMKKPGQSFSNWYRKPTTTVWHSLWKTT